MKAELEKRIAEIETAMKKTHENIAQLTAQLQQLEGRRQELLFWLNKKEKDEKKPKAVKAAKNTE